MAITDKGIPFIFTYLRTNIIQVLIMSNELLKREHKPAPVYIVYST